MVKPLQTLRNLPRLRDISWVLARHGLKDLSTRLGAGLGTRLFGFENPHIPFAGRLRLAFQELGPIYIKLGQLIASRPDIFPEDLVSEMERLRDDVDPVSFDEVKPVIEKSLGGEIQQLFRQFEEIPVASASIAQVYKAITLDGRSVAVKVRKPGIEKLIERDLGLLDQFAEALSRQPESGGFDPVAVVRELHHALEGELNFFMEKNSIDRIRDFFEEDPSVAIPQTMSELCTGEVLVMDWFDGIPAGKMETSDPRRQDLVRLCSRS
ncbi:MAG: ABC1 kinase family protein, partial [Planctomycetota bacterium]